MKGFIEVTSVHNDSIKYIVHYATIRIMKYDNQIDCFSNEKWLKETYEEIKELIKNAQ